MLYTGSGGQTRSAATFTLTGKLGSTSISVLPDEDLDDVAAKMNDASHQTGVVASVDGDELTLTSVYDGFANEIAVAVSDGSFAVTGGNGDGTANGAAMRSPGSTAPSTPARAAASRSTRTAFMSRSSSRAGSPATSTP